MLMISKGSGDVRIFGIPSGKHESVGSFSLPGMTRSPSGPRLRDEGIAASNRAWAQAVIGGRSLGSTRQHSNASRGVFLAGLTAQTPSRSCLTAEEAAFAFASCRGCRPDCARRLDQAPVTINSEAIPRKNARVMG